MAEVSLGVDGVSHFLFEGFYVGEAAFGFSIPEAFAVDAYFKKATRVGV